MEKAETQGGPMEFDEVLEIVQKMSEGCVHRLIAIDWDQCGICQETGQPNLRACCLRCGWFGWVHELEIGAEYRRASYGENVWTRDPAQEKSQG